MNNFKKCACAIIASALMISLGGCSGNSENSYSEELKNLDLSETVIKQNTPDSGQWYVYKFRKYRTSSETAKHLREASRALGFDEFDLHKVICKVGVSSDTDTDISFDDANEYNNVRYTRYCSDDHYIHIDNTGSMVFNDRRSLKSVIEEEWVLDLLNSDTGDYWMPQIGGAKIVKRYDVSDTTELCGKYSLNGKEGSVKEEPEYAETFINSKQFPHLVSNFFSYKPIEVRVYQHSPEKYGFYFIFVPTRDGVPPDGSNTVNIDGCGNLFASRDHIYMANDKTIDYIWTGSLCGDEPSAKEPCEIKIGYENACRVVSERLSHEHVFKVESAELIYCIDGGENSEYNTVKPMWQFIITNSGMKYGTVCVNVDAVSGEMFMRGVME